MSPGAYKIRGFEEVGDYCPIPSGKIVLARKCVEVKVNTPSI